MTAISATNIGDTPLESNPQTTPASSVQAASTSAVANTIFSSAPSSTTEATTTPPTASIVVVTQPSPAPTVTLQSPSIVSSAATSATGRPKLKKGEPIPVGATDEEIEAYLEEDSDEDGNSDDCKNCTQLVSGLIRVVQFLKCCGFLIECINGADKCLRSLKK